MLSAVNNGQGFKTCVSTCTTQLNSTQKLNETKKIII